MSEIRRGRKDLSDKERPWQAADIAIDEMLAHRIDLDPHTTAWKLAHSLGGSLQTMVAH
jgi:hypothetical protein